MNGYLPYFNPHGGGSNPPTIPRPARRRLERARYPTFSTVKLSWNARDIPHGFLNDTPIHLIYRVRGCAPVKKLRMLHEDLRERLAVVKTMGTFSDEVLGEAMEEWQAAYDNLLDAQDQRKYVLADPTAAQLVLDSWQTLRDRAEVKLYAVCIMGNHVHALLSGVEGAPETRIAPLVGRHKSFTDNAIKKALGHKANVWDDGFYDRYVRPGTFEQVLRYLLDNPVKAGLVQHWRAWPHTFVDERCVAWLEAW